MKRNKHITINITEDEYNRLLFLADHQRRKLADAAYILLVDAIDEALIKKVNINSDSLKEIKIK